MICSLNQIEQNARKATRGAGLARGDAGPHWGLAFDTGRAVRWLQAHGFHGAAALADYLENISPAQHEYAAPHALNGVWHAADPSRALDPLITGAAISDCIETAGEITTGAIAHPLLAAGFLGAAARGDGSMFALEWSGGARLQCAQGEARMQNENAFDAARAEFFKCRRIDIDARGENILRGRRRQMRTTETKLSRDVWRRLEKFARITYVAASETSRLTGAGAGLHDND